MKKLPNHILFKLTFVIFGIIILITSKALSQDFIHQDDFKKKTSQGIVLVEFWAEFNSINQVNLKKIYDCKKYRVDMSLDPSLMVTHKVMAVPTVVIYHNGKEVKRFLPSLMMKLDVEIKDIQDVIDELVDDKF
jgi:thioredoxin-like negative regulator of GroEL|tara:strand:+ start:1187 stop:1588 length:402 start_codon:yes stop_codon:yes gene_type:complete